MRGFVSDIRTATNEGRTSMDNTIKSTQSMSEKIEGVNETISENVKLLEGAVDNIQSITEEIKGVQNAVEDINKAMDSSSRDAENLSFMTVRIREDAEHSAMMAKKISEIDTELAGIINEQLDVINKGAHQLTNSEIVKEIREAKVTHTAWINKLSQIIENKEVLPLQLNSKKCAFGHFYHALNISHPSISNQWAKIDTIHNDFHNLGDVAIKALESNDEIKTHETLNRAKQLSSEMFVLLDEIIGKLDSLDEGIFVFKTV